MQQARIYQPSRSVPARLGRRLVQWSRGAPAIVAPDRPVVSFTFDDFPKSALAGADVIEAHGGRAGFYASTSFLGRTDPMMGEMFDAATLAELATRGHEIGAHTHGHIDCARKTREAVEKDIAANLVALAVAGHAATVSSFAWPYGETSFAAKRWAADVFATARGVLPGVNVGEADRAQLRAVELGDSEASRRRAFAMLETCIQSNGWLFFFTHGVSKSPSPFGCSPDLIDELCKRAVDRGAVLATPSLGAALSGVIN
jgi:peptidoglycan/xylan/chitin deacetylase (PgdA/CDA1 family)